MGDLERLRELRQSWVSAHRRLAASGLGERQGAEDAYFAADRAYARGLVIHEKGLLEAYEQRASLLARIETLEKENERLVQDRRSLRESLEHLTFRALNIYAPEMSRYTPLDSLARSLKYDANAALDAIDAIAARVRAERGTAGHTEENQ